MIDTQDKTIEKVETTKKENRKVAASLCASTRHRDSRDTPPRSNTVCDGSTRITQILALADRNSYPKDETKVKEGPHGHRRLLAGRAAQLQHLGRRRQQRPGSPFAG